MVQIDLRSLESYASFRSGNLASFVEAARVMLWKFHDVPPPDTAGMWTHDGAGQDVELAWEEPSEHDQAAHANELDATECAGYAVALAIANQLGFRVIGRVHHGSGADWIMVPRGEPTNDYYKLEVSGIARVSPTNRPEDRLVAKVAQASRGDYERPGIAVVARFEDARILSASWT